MWLQQDIEIWKKIIFKTQNYENFGSLVIICEISQVSDILLYRHDMWLTNKILRYMRIVRFKRQNVKISPRSLRSLVIIYDLKKYLLFL